MAGRDDPIPVGTTILISVQYLKFCDYILILDLAYETFDVHTIHVCFVCFM